MGYALIGYLKGKISSSPLNHRHFIITTESSPLNHRKNVTSGTTVVRYHELNPFRCFSALYSVAISQLFSSRCSSAILQSLFPF